MEITESTRQLWPRRRTTAGKHGPVGRNCGSPQSALDRSQRCKSTQKGKQIGAERLEKRTVFNRRREEIKFPAKTTKKRHPNAPLVYFYSERFLGHSRSSRELLLQSWLVGGRSRRDAGVRGPHWGRGRGRVVTVCQWGETDCEILIARY